MSELLLDSLEIKGYRCFEHLMIEKLGRVNLIVGKNNVGKTALLEALWLYAQKGRLGTIDEILLARNESASQLESNGDSAISLHGIENLFSNRPDLELNGDANFTIGSSKEGYLLSKVTKNLDLLADKIEKQSYEMNSFLLNLLGTSGRTNFFSIYFENKKSSEGKLTELFSAESFQQIPFHFFGKKSFLFPSLFISSNGLSNNKLLEFWDEAELRQSVDKILSAMRILSPEILRISFVGNPPGSNNRIPSIIFDDIQRPIPLRSFGEGMSKIFGIALSLVNCERGMLFIDEVENGLHYSVLPDVWKLIFKIARDLNVQVFATTHSWDCIEAFTQAAIEDKESEGMLIRLENKNDKIKATTFSEKELEAVTRRNIEVR